MKDLKRRTLAIFLAVALCLGYAVPIGNFLPFGANIGDDAFVYGAEGHWAEAYLDKLVSEGIMRGDKEGQLNPEAGITRSEFVAMINRSFGYKVKGAKTFSDVDPAAWYADDISIAAQQGYFVGTDGGAAKPDDVLKREEAVTLLCRALKIEGITEDNYNFVDSRDFSYWSKEFIHAATEKEYVKGYPDQTFRPTYEMKRGEMAKVLSDATGNIVQKPGDANVGYTPGNVTLNTSGTNLKSTTVPGDLYITGGVGLGYTTLENVTVLGDLIISGAGESNSGDNSVVLKDCKIKNMIVNSSNGKKLSIRAEGSTDIEKTTVKTETYLEEGNVRYSAFKDVELNGASGTKLQLAGIFESVSVLGEKNELSLLKGYIERMLVDEVATGAKLFFEKDTEVNDMFLDTGVAVTGTGKINSVVIAANGSNIAVLPGTIAIRPGVTATINGKLMTSTDAEMDALKPEITVAPTIENKMATAADAVLRVNKPGKVYWMIKVAGDTAPSLAQLKTPKTGDGIKFANAPVVQDKDTTLKLSGLLSGKTYDLYTVLVDLRDNSSVVVKTTFTTIDNIKPQFNAGTPKVSKYTATTLKVDFSLSKSANVYWAAMPAKSPAPTADDLMHSDSRIPMGNIERGVSACEYPNMGTIEVQGLSEMNSYDIYMVAKDWSDNSNLSAVTKVTGMTGDETLPYFVVPTPNVDQDKIAASSIGVNVRASEDSTVYWALCKKGTVFPVPPKGETVPPTLNSQEAKQAVKSGSGSFKNGNLSLKGSGDKDTLINITGLTEQTPYDLYMVLMDKSNLYSNSVTKVEIKTKDTLPPTASLTFVGDGTPMASAEFTIEFSELVVSGSVDIKETGRTFESLDPGLISKYIKLQEYATGGLAEKKINFDNVKITEKDGKTRFTFKGSDIKLASGMGYKVTFADIMDTSGNYLKGSNAVIEFTTVPPQVYFESMETSGEYDMGIQMTPSQNTTSDTTLYDVILKSDVPVEFTLKVFVEQTKGAKDFSQTATYSGIKLSGDNTEESMTALIKNVDPTADFMQFNQFDTAVQYLFEVTKYKEQANNDLWTGEVNVISRGIIGPKTSLVKIGNNVAINLDKEIKSKTVFVVSNAPLEIWQSFKEKTPPNFQSGMPVFKPADSSLGITAATDKSGKMYYMIAKKGVINATPTAIEMMDMSPKQGVIQSSFEVSTISKTNYVAGLDAKKEYDIYYMTVGAGGKSTVTYDTFKTTDWEKPNLTLIPGAPAKLGANVVAKVNVDSNVYYMLFPSDVNVGAITADQIIKVDEGLKNDAKATGRMLDVSSVGNGVTLNFKDLVDKKDYVLYAVAAKHDISTPSDVMVLKNIRAADMTSPFILKEKTASTTNSSIGGFDSTVSMSFSEPLYYITNRTDRISKPLTEEAIRTNLPTGVVISQIAADSKTGAIETLELQIKGWTPGRTILFKYDICDFMNNEAGRLNLELVRNTGADSIDIPVKWIVTFDQTSIPSK